MNTSLLEQGINSDELQAIIDSEYELIETLEAANG